MNKRIQSAKIINSAEFKVTAQLANSLLTSGSGFSSTKELVETAIAIRDELIEQVEEKL
ncbi:MAG: hypothetical protein AAFQ41_02325 [Cyanobacteria bacterium J06623_7]